MGAGFVGWVDVDSCYCSAESLRYRTLRGVPLAVVGNNGGCIIARTRDAAKLGVKVGSAVWEARRLCPGLVLAKRDFDWLDEVSSRLLAEVKSLSPRVQYYSVDEMGFEAMPAEGSYQGAAELMRRRISDNVGLPSTCAVARTPTLAKLVCDLSKPYGASAVIDRRAEESLLAAFPADAICGIGGQRAATLAHCGINTALDFARADRRLIRRLLTVVGEMLWYEVNGEQVQELEVERRKHKMFSRGGSVGRETADPYMILGWVVRHLERLVEEFRFHRQKTGRVTLSICYRKGSDRHGVTRQARSSVVPPSDRFDFLLDPFLSCLRAVFSPGLAATRIHLYADRLCPRSESQLSLFDDPDSTGDAVEGLKEQVNARHGRFALRSAATLALPEVYADPATYKEICDIRGKSHF